jgi:hypothetical protein
VAHGGHRGAVVVVLQRAVADALRARGTLAADVQRRGGVGAALVHLMHELGGAVPATLRIEPPARRRTVAARVRGATSRHRSSSAIACGRTLERAVQPRFALGEPRGSGGDVARRRRAQRPGRTPTAGTSGGRTRTPRRSSHGSGPRPRASTSEPWCRWSPERNRDRRGHRTAGRRASRSGGGSSWRAHRPGARHPRPARRAAWHTRASASACLRPCRSPAPRHRMLELPFTDDATWRRSCRSSCAGSCRPIRVLPASASR